MLSQNLFLIWNKRRKKEYISSGRLTFLSIDFQGMKDFPKNGMTVLVVTHEMGFAKEVGSHLVFMDLGQHSQERSCL